MRTKALLSLPAILLAAGFGRAVCAAEPNVVPQMHAGYTDQAPTVAVSPKADQITATRAIGAELRNSEGTLVGRIADILIDRRSGAAALAIIAPAGAAGFGPSPSAVAWSSLAFQPRPTPHFVTRLGAQALAAGHAAASEAAASRGYADVGKDLLGKTVVGADGKPVGKVADLVLSFGSGQVAALVVRADGFITLAGAKDHAVAWDAAQPRVERDAGKVRVALTKAQIEAAPVTDTLAPAPIAPKAGSKTEIRRDATGNISGTLIPAPADRR